MELKIDAKTLKKALKKAGFKMYENDKKNYNLNIIGIRNTNPVVDKFGDLIVVAWKFKGKWEIKTFEATTYPGLKALVKPINPKGCAILKPGRYEKTWKISLHRNSYEALCQRKAVTVYRDNDKDVELDLVDGKEQTGLFGINIHRANRTRVLDQIGPHSAGCQVFADPKDFAEFMNICKASKHIWGEWFTYTLITDKDFE